MEVDIAKADLRLMARGQVAAFVFALSGLVAATVIAALGYPTAAGTIGTTTIISVVGAFLYQRQKA